MFTFKSVRSIATIAAILGSAALVSACGANDRNGATNATPTPTSTPNPTTGTVATTWAYSGSQAPSKVRLELVDGVSTGFTCTTLPFNIGSGIVQNMQNLPANGAANFLQVAPGTKYLVVAVGELANGTRVAQACRDQVNVIAGQTTNVDLSLLAFAPDMTGVYTVAQNLNIGLPTDIQNALNVLAAACGVLNDPQLCDVVNQVDQVLTSMDVVSEWTLDRQLDGSYKGTVRWISVMGYDVTAIDPIAGGFDATNPTAAQIQYKNFDLQIQFGNLVLFVVQDVLGYDLGSLGPVGAGVITALAGNYVGPLDFTGVGTVTDGNADGAADTLQGNLAGHLAVSGWQHDFTMDYLGLKQ